MVQNLKNRNRATLWLRSAMMTLALALGIAAQAEPIVVTGTVTAAVDDEPLIGAAVQVKETGAGVTTDIDGNYRISAEMGQTLTVSYVGCVSQEAKITSDHIDFVLEDNAAKLEEVVVVGYGVQKKKLVTGATAQMKGDDISKLNTTSPLQAMQGQMPGVQISSTSGQPGESMKVTIRGLGTVGNSGPLYLIDGVGGDISTLNPADIESIDVLKDAASAAIYGAQAANGVVLITTKQGKEGKAKVTFDGYYGWQSAARKTKMLNAQQYMAIMDEQAVNEGNAPYDWANMTSIYDANGNLIDTDWVSSMFNDNAPMQSYTIGVTGGSATSTYSISLGYLSQEGIVGGKGHSDYSRYNFRVNSDHKLWNNLLTVGEQVSFVYTKKQGVSVGNQYSNTLRGAFTTSPIAPIYDADGNYNATDDSDWYAYDGNPYASMMLSSNNRTNAATFSGNAYAQLEPFKNFKIRTVLGVLYQTSEYRSYTPIYHLSPYSYSDHTSASQSMWHGLGITWTNTASYDFELGDHAFNVLIGMEAYRYKGTSLAASTRDLRDGFDTWQYAYISNGTAATTTDGLSASGAPDDESRTVSYFGRLGWNWKEKYMINFTLRSDGSSRFAKGHRFGYFPSVSAGWNITNEEFMESTRSFLSYFKLRASWGRVGNQNIDNYQYLAPITTSGTHYFFGEYIGAGGTYNDFASILANNWGAYPSRLANEDVTWETSEQTNIGFDATLLRSHLGVNFDFYIKNTKDWLVQAPILQTTGTGAPFINGGNVKNTGVELNLTWNDNIGRDFSYSLGVNGSYNRNRVGEIPTEDGIIHGSTNQLYDNTPEFYRAENGHAIGYFWGYKVAGVFQSEQDIQDWIAAGNGVYQSNPQPGDVKFFDINHDGVIDENDKVDLGNGMPKFTFGFNVNLFYKGFDLGVTATGAAGFKIAQSYRGHNNQTNNYTTAILNRWTGEGTSNFYPRVTENNYNYGDFSDLYLQDGDYLRISNITLGYDFAKLIKQNWCSQARVYVQVQNAFTFTKYDGMDPEIGYGTDSWVSGIDLGYYPRPRTYLVGVNLAF